MLNFLLGLFGKGKPSIQELLKDGAIVVDVRTSGEYRSGHVKGSKNIPLQSLSSKIKKLKRKNKVVITCCASGMRSGKAARVLRQSGLDAYNGGSWQAVERARK